MTQSYTRVCIQMKDNERSQIRIYDLSRINLSTFKKIILNNNDKSIGFDLL